MLNRAEEEEEEALLSGWIRLYLKYQMIVLFDDKLRWSEEDTHGENGALAWVQHTQGLVFAGGENLGAVPVPAGAVDEVSVHAVDPHHRLGARHVPQDHHVIASCAGNGKQNASR